MFHLCQMPFSTTCCVGPARGPGFILGGGRLVRPRYAASGLPDRGDAQLLQRLPATS